MGSFKAGHYDGRGRMQFPDGTTYVGGWSGSVFHGEGTVTTPQGLQFTGAFRAGECVGEPLVGLVGASPADSTPPVVALQLSGQ